MKTSHERNSYFTSHRRQKSSPSKQFAHNSIEKQAEEKALACRRTSDETPHTPVAVKLHI
jgi:hypothetical protein